MWHLKAVSLPSWAMPVSMLWCLRTIGNKKKTRCAGICVRNTGTIESCTLRGTKVLIGLGGNWGETEGSQIAVENTGVIKDTVFLE